MSECERSLSVERSTDGMLTIIGEKLAGYAVVYNATSHGAVRVAPNGAALPERFNTGAFTESLASKQNVTFVFEHKDIAEYGDTTTGTLRLWEDKVGIAFELDLPAYAHTLRSQIANGAIRGMSFRFNPKAMEVVDNVRHIQKAELIHISPVYSPAYPQTSVEITRSKNINDKKSKLLDLLERG